LNNKKTKKLIQKEVEEDQSLMKMSKLKFAIWVMVVGLIIISPLRYRLASIDHQK